jgi:hypothetical protein
MTIQSLFFRVLISFVFAFVTLYLAFVFDRECPSSLYLFVVFDACIVTVDHCVVKELIDVLVVIPGYERMFSKSNEETIAIGD